VEKTCVFFSGLGMNSGTNSKISWAASGILAIGLSLLISYQIYRKFYPKNKRKVIFVVGGPGTGKGTQCALISEKYGYTHLSAGDLLRQEISSGSELGEKLKQILAEGKLVSSDITTSFLIRAMEQSENDKFLIDGFPRSMENLHCWEELAPTNIELQFLLLLECPEPVLLTRLLHRGKTSGRSDDTEEVIKQRFRTSNAMTAPVVEHYRSTGQLRVVDSNRPPQDVFADISVHLDNANWNRIFSE
jgi:UMP-CMP kinase